ncbi:MAG: hypothetical protein JWM43_2448 [Acidobacteriaceae bacterium]|nr:hypothetical protein [Acidobacteriaceae bacterium]
MKTPDTNSTSRGQSRSILFRQAVLAVFAASSDKAANPLGHFCEKVWNANLQWLDTSGLALYLYDQLIQLNQEHSMPSAVLARLRQNHADNIDRNSQLLAEAIEINHAFQREGFVFAHIKGITLSPDSVPNASLRCQLDLDFLIQTDQADAARLVLERMGYTLDFKVGKTWEFRTGVSEVVKITDLYKAKSQRSIDLHLVPQDGLLDRLQLRSFSGVACPVLSPADQFISQAKHLFKHLCCAFTRAAWLLEYRRNLLSHRNDPGFWEQVERLLVKEPETVLAIAVVTLLVSEVFGDPMPAAITTTVPAPVQLWIKLYGHRILTADFPGTKLYLLLQAELDPKAVPARRSKRKELLPLSRPPMITYGYEGESLLSRSRRYRAQLQFIRFRLRFHCVEGIHYLFEVSRFKRLVTGLPH